MAFFSALAAGAGALFAAATTTAIGQILTGVAVNALAGALFAPSTPGRVSNPIMDKGQLGIVARSFIVGTYATKGSIVYRNSYGTGNDDPTEKFVVVYALSDLPVRELTRMWINNEECTLQARTIGPRGWAIPEFDYDDKAKAYYKFYDGTQTAADPELVNNVSTDERPWKSAHVGKGIAYAVLTFDHDPRVWTTGRPEVLFEVKGYRFRDPSTGAMGTGDNLPATQMHGILSRIDYDGKWFYGPQKPAILPNANWSKAVGDCRKQVPGADKWTTAQRNAAFRDGTVPARYASGLEVSVDRPISEVCQDLATACNGRFAEVAGEWKFQVGNPPPVSEADFTFSDDDISTLDGQTFSPFLPLAETVNAVTATYPDPESQYNMQEAPALYVPAYEREDGNRRLATTVQMNAVTAKEQVQRLMKGALAESRRARRHTITLSSKFFAVEPGDYGAWDSNRNGYIKKLFRVDGIRDEANGSVTLDLTECDPSDYDFDGPDFQVVSSGSLVTPEEPTYVVPNFSVEPHIIRDDAGQPRRAAIRLSWDTDRRGRGIAFRVYPEGRNEIVTRGTTMEFDAGALVTADGIVGGRKYEVQARRLTRSGKTPWTGRLKVTAPDIKFGDDDLRQEVLDDLAAGRAASKNADRAIAELEEAAEKYGGRLVNILDKVNAGEIGGDFDYETIRQEISAAKNGAQSYADKQILALSGPNGAITAVRENLEAALIPNLGFEDVKGRDAGEPTGWKLVTAVGGELVVRHHTNQLAPGTKGKYSFGSETTDAGPWWYLAKVFRFTRLQNIRVLAKGWANTPGSSNNPNSGFVGEDDFFIHFIQYDEAGAILDQSTTNSGVYTTYLSENRFRSGWHTRDSLRTGVNRVAYVEVRLVAADGNGSNIADKTNYSQFSGNAAVLFDDIEMSSDNGTLIEVDPSNFNRVTGLSGQIESIRQLDIGSDTAFGQLLTDLEVNAAGKSAAVRQQAVAIADLQGNQAGLFKVAVRAGNQVSSIALVAEDGSIETSAIKLDAQDIILNGSVVAKHITVDNLTALGIKVLEGEIEDLTVTTLKLKKNSITRGANQYTNRGVSSLGGLDGDGSQVTHFSEQNYLSAAISNTEAYDLYFWVTVIGDGLVYNVSLNDNAGCFRGTEFLTKSAEISGSDSLSSSMQGVTTDKNGLTRIRLNVARLPGTSGDLVAAAITLLAVMR